MGKRKLNLDYHEIIPDACSHELLSHLMPLTKRVAEAGTCAISLVLEHFLTVGWAWWGRGRLGGEVSKGRERRGCMLQAASVLILSIHFET